MVACRRFHSTTKRLDEDNDDSDVDIESSNLASRSDDKWLHFRAY
jgi:hypothetical protein